MSSFLIYIYTIVHLIYFFYTVLNTQTYFAVCDIFILFLWICFSILFSLVSITGWISQKKKKKMMSKTNILPLLITIP